MKGSYGKKWKVKDHDSTRTEDEKTIKPKRDVIDLEGRQRGGF